MIEPATQAFQRDAYQAAHQMRSAIFVAILRWLITLPSAARPDGVVTTEEGAGCARPAPC